MTVGAGPLAQGGEGGGGGSADGGSVWGGEGLLRSGDFLPTWADLLHLGDYGGDVW